MGNVTQFPKKAPKPRSRNEGRSMFFVEGGKTADGPWVLATIEDHADKAIVRVMPLRTDPVGAPKRKYIVDTVLEGFRLAYRVHGFHKVIIRQTGPYEFQVQNVPSISGSGEQSA